MANGTRRMDRLERIREIADRRRHGRDAEHHGPATEEHGDEEVEAEATTEVEIDPALHAFSEKFRRGAGAEG